MGSDNDSSKGSDSSPFSPKTPNKNQNFNLKLIEQTDNVNTDCEDESKTPNN